MPRTLVYGLLSGLGVALLVLVGVMIHYGVLISDHQEFTEARNHYRTVGTQLSTFQDRIDRVDERLRNMALMEHKLRLMTRLEDPERNIAIGPVTDAETNSAAISGVLNNPSGNLRSEVLGEGPGGKESFEVKQMAYRLEKLDGESKARQLSLEELSAILEDQRDLLVSTPSIWPARGFRSSSFGYRISPFTNRKRMHEGLDIAAPRGTVVVAPGDGIVTYRGLKGAYGKLVVLDHGYGVVTRYGHVSEILVAHGQRVARGDIIAKVGNTGRSTGDHLHYEVRQDGLPVDPMMYILD